MGVHIFALFAVLYAMGTSGTFLGNADTVFMFGVAQSLAVSGNISVSLEAQELQPPVGGYEHLRGVDGRMYVAKGLSYSALLVPFYLVGTLITHLDASLERPPWHAIVTMFSASLAGPMLGAVECLIIYLTVLAFGFAVRVAGATALTAGVATSVWANSKSNFAEPLLGLMITAGYYALVQYSRTGAIKWAALIGASMSILVLSQPAMLALAVPVFTIFTAYIAIRTNKVDLRSGVTVAAAFLTPVLTGVILLAALNVMRYGSAAETGYGGLLGRWSDLYIGVYGVLFSAGKSILLYSPPLIFSCLVAVRFVRIVGPLGILPWSLLAVFLVSYGGLAIWSGDGAWGPRYFLPLTGVLSIVMCAFFASATVGLAHRLVTWALTIVGCLVQIVGVATDTAAYFGLLIANGVISPGPGSPQWTPVLFDPEFTPIVGRTRLLISAIHRYAFGSSLTWSIHGRSGAETAIPLTGYDRLALWPAWLDVLGALHSPTAAALVVLVIVLAVTAVLYCLWKLRWLTSSPNTAT